MLPEAVLDLIADEQLRSDPAIKDYNDLGSLVKSHVEQGRMLGSSVKIPGEDAKPEEISAFHTKLGRPEKAELYDFKHPEGMDERFKTDEESITAFKTLAHEVGLTPTQFNRITGFYNELATKDAQGFPTPEATETLLKGEWKDDYEKKFGDARRAVVKFGQGTNFADWLDETGFGNLPEMARFLSAVGATLGESKVPLDTHSQQNASAEEAKAKISAVYDDKDHAYHHRENPNHKEAVLAMQKLFQLAHGNEELFTTAR